MVIRVQNTIFDKKRLKMKNLYISLIVIFIFVITACSKKQGEFNIKVMTLNVRYDNPSDSVYSWPKRASQVFDLSKNPLKVYGGPTGPFSVIK